MATEYTKAQLEELVYVQLKNLNAMHDLLRIVKTQNELLEGVNKKLSEEILGSNKVEYPKGS